MNHINERTRLIKKDKPKNAFHKIVIATTKLTGRITLVSLLVSVVVGCIAIYYAYQTAVIRERTLTDSKTFSDEQLNNSKI